MADEKNKAPQAPNAEALAKLKELASDRVKRAVQAVKSVGNLAEFHPTAAQQKAMVAAMRSAVDQSEKMLAVTNAIGSDGFELPDA